VWVNTLPPCLCIRGMVLALSEAVGVGEIRHRHARVATGKWEGWAINAPCGSPS